MAEFDDKLNSLLSNPEAMDQIMKMAQSLMGGGQTPEGTAPSAPGGPAPQSGPPPTGTWNTPQNGGFPPQASPPNPQGQGWTLLPVLRELGEAQNSNARQLLFALRPYLKPERQDKVERALQLARLFRVGKKFLLKGDGHV